MTLKPSVDLPDQLPSLTPAPPKKSRFKANRVTFEDDDVEERLDRNDSHISAVLSRIVVSAKFTAAMFTWLLLTFVHIFHYLINGCVTFLIKERDTSCTPISLPALTGMPFPKVLHRSEPGCQVKSHLFKSLPK